MSQPDKQNSFARTRDDHRTELQEDYVEIIAGLIAEKGRPARWILPGHWVCRRQR